MVQSVIYITDEILRDICYKLTVKYFQEDGEPIGAYETRDEGKVSSFLSNPQRSFGGVDLYPTLYEKAAVLYYGIAKAHAFENGNKRLATVALLTFLSINDIEFKISDKELEDLVVRVAESPSSEMQQTLSMIVGLLERHCVPFVE